MYNPGSESRKSAKVSKPGAKPVLAADISLPLAPTVIVDRTVSSALAGLPVTATHFAEIEAYVRTSVAEEIARRGVPEDKLRWPRLDVVVPAVEALRYSENREAFTSLIASTMDARIANVVLPAYVEMLKQISKDEMCLLAAMPQLGRYTPVADIVHVLPNGQVITAYRHALLPELAATCSIASNIPQYVDNLVRLNLIARPLEQQAADLAYRAISQQDFVKKLMKAAPTKTQSGIEKAVCGLTDLGDTFRRVCIGEAAVAPGKC
jgi:hypothetical protein